MDENDRKKRTEGMLDFILSKHPQERHASILRRVLDAKGMVFFKGQSGAYVCPFELDLDADLARAARGRLGDIADEVS